MKSLTKTAHTIEEKLKQLVLTKEDVDEISNQLDEVIADIKTDNKLFKRLGK